jgi:hypothetical protein
MRSLSQLEKLEKEAHERRARFNATLLDVQNQLTLPGLAREALRHVDPHLARLPPAFLAVKRHPVVAAAALAGASYLLKQVLRPARGTFGNSRTPPSDYPHIPPAKPKKLRKEIIHESE